MKTFVWQNGKPQAMKKHNDDLIMACAIGCWVKDTALSSNERSVAYQKAFLNSITTTNRMMNTAIPGMAGYEKLEKEQKMRNAANTYKDNLWLLKG